MRVSGDGRTVGVVGLLGSVEFWSIVSGTAVVLERFDPARDAVFSPDGASFAVSEPAGVTIVSVEDRSVRRTLSQVSAFPGDDPAVLAFSPDGRSLLAGHATGDLVVWDVEEGVEREPRPRGVAVFGS